MQNCQYSVSSAEENARFHSGGTLFIGSLSNSKDLLASSQSYLILYVSKQHWALLLCWDTNEVVENFIWKVCLGSFHSACLYFNTVLHFDWKWPCSLKGFLSLSNDVLPLSSLYENKKLCIWAHLLLRGRDWLIWSSRHMECTRWA